MTAAPFLRWVGGKGKLLPAILPLLPPSFNRYFEPFCGGAAMFWALRPERATLSDANPRLINAYQVIRDDVEALIADLSQRRYAAAEFYATRARLNSCEGSPVQRAADFIYINRCGFNGLWRVNGRGDCNVPHGRTSTGAPPTICDAESLRACSAALQGVELHTLGFGWVESEAQAGDLVYFDPPYWPASATSRFTGYTAGGFTSDDQERLAGIFRALSARGVHCVLSNSDVQAVRELFAGFQIVPLSRQGTMSSKTTGRGRAGEVLVLGGTWDSMGAAKEVVA